MEENTSEQTNIHEEIATEEAQAINAYIDKVYVLKVPMPQKPTKNDVSFFNIVGIEAMGYTFSALCGVVLSAIRTGGLFYLLEELLLKKYTFIKDPIVITIICAISALVALGTFEGYLLFDGFSKGKNKKDITVSRIGVGIAFIVTICAGLFSSFVIVDIPKDTQTNLDIIIAIVTGAGASIITYLGGVNIGYTFTLFGIKKREIFDEYQNRYNSWRESGVKSYKTSQFNFNRKGGSIYSKPVQSNVQSEQKIEQSVQEVFVVEKPLPIYEQIRIKIEKYVEDNHALPPVNKFSDENNFSKAYVSTSLNEYIFKNQKWLLDEGLVDLDRIQKAKNSVEKVKPGLTQVDSDGWPTE